MCRRGTVMDRCLPMQRCGRTNAVRVCAQLTRLDAHHDGGIARYELCFARSKADLRRVKRRERDLVIQTATAKRTPPVIAVGNLRERADRFVMMKKTRETRKTQGQRQMDLIELARESGMAVLLDGRIGREEYVSVSGSLAALARFADAIRKEPAKDESEDGKS